MIPIEVEENVQQNSVGNFTISLFVPSIKCAACSSLIKKSLDDIPGINQVDINLGEKSVFLDFQDRAIIKKIYKILDRLDFKPIIANTANLDNPLKLENKSYISKIGVAGIGMMQVMMYSFSGYFSGPDGIEESYKILFRWASLIMTIPVFMYSASTFLIGAYRDLKNIHFGMDVPIALAITASFLLSLHNTLMNTGEVYYDSVCMFTFFLLIGRYVEFLSRNKFQKSKGLIDNLLPNYVRVSRKPEEFKPIEELNIGNTVYLQAGETIPCDGKLIDGISSANESAFTGEAMPVVKTIGDRVLAGTKNLENNITVKVTKDRKEYLINDIKELFNKSSFYKPSFSILVDKIAGHFVAIVLIASLASCLYWFYKGDPFWLSIGLTVLVVSCPCALSLATPIAYTVATTTLRKNGIILKEGTFIEKLAQIDSIAFDKTGTLTKGDIKISKTIILGDLSLNKVINIAASLEQYNDHPVANAFGVGDLPLSNYQNFPGKGVSGEIEGVVYKLGIPEFSFDNNLLSPDLSGMWVLLASSKPLAWFRLEDSIKKEAFKTINKIKDLGFHLSLLTGDSSDQGKKIGDFLGIRNTKTNLTPEQKVEAVLELQSKNQNVLLVGDGINDIGAMGVSNTSIAIKPVDISVQSSSDAILLGGNLKSIVFALKFSKKVKRILTSNIAWAVGYNITAIPLAMAGYILPWMAALGMSLSSMVVVFNSYRLNSN